VEVVIRQEQRAESKMGEFLSRWSKRLGCGPRAVQIQVTRGITGLEDHMQGMSIDGVDSRD